MSKKLTPSKIVEELDKYIIGQQEAKKAVAIALRNRWRRLNVEEPMRSEIMPNNILMIGATGVGKTEIARRLAQLADAPFIKVEASKFTEVGYVGRDVESMVRDLVEYGVNMVKAASKLQVLEKAKENVDEILVDALYRPLAKNKNIGENKDGDNEEDRVQEKLRQKFHQLLKDGKLEDKKISIDITSPTHSVQVFGPAGFEGLEGLQDFLSNIAPKRKKKRVLTVAEAREYLLEEEAQKLIDMDLVTKEAIAKCESSGIIFIDEVDKIVSSGNNGKGGPDVSREGVQRDLLPIIEGTVVNTKYGSVKTDHILFIAAGAFHVAKPSDLIPELQGRLPIRVELNSLTREDFVRILTEPRNALTRQYKALLASEGVNLIFEEESIEEIASIAYEVNQQVENIGARRLHTIMSSLLDEILFEVPDLTETKEFIITKDFVKSKLEPLVKSKDLSHFIL
jgi:ATP-dependent HslUV protease ATP-binding subunit HslU